MRQIRNDVSEGRIPGHQFGLMAIVCLASTAVSWSEDPLVINCALLVNRVKGNGEIGGGSPADWKLEMNAEITDYIVLGIGEIPFGVLELQIEILY